MTVSPTANRALRPFNGGAAPNEHLKKDPRHAMTPQEGIEGLGADLLDRGRPELHRRPELDRSRRRCPAVPGRVRRRRQRTDRYTVCDGRDTGLEHQRAGGGGALFERQVRVDLGELK